MSNKSIHLKSAYSQTYVHPTTGWGRSRDPQEGPLCASRVPWLTSRIIRSISQDVRCSFTTAFKLCLPVCRRVLEPGIWEAIRHGRVRHPALENKQGNNREDAKEEGGTEGKVNEVALSSRSVSSLGSGRREQRVTPSQHLLLG